MKETWYALSDKANGQPVCYLKNKSEIINFKENVLRYSKIEKMNHRPSQLDYIIKKDGEIIGSFEFKNHAIQYNLEKLNFKGEIHPNPQYSQLEMNL